MTARMWVNIQCCMCLAVCSAQGMSNTSLGSAGKAKWRGVQSFSGTCKPAAVGPVNAHVGAPWCMHIAWQQHGNIVQTCLPCI